MSNFYIYQYINILISFSYFNVYGGLFFHLRQHLDVLIHLEIATLSNSGIYQHIEFESSLANTLIFSPKSFFLLIYTFLVWYSIISIWCNAVCNDWCFWNTEKKTISTHIKIYFVKLFWWAIPILRGEIGYFREIFLIV